ncbi:hypothetical protein ES703_83995 [subsurface metagenome]
MLGGGDGVAGGGVDHDDAVLGGFVDSDVVHADAGAGDDLQLFAGPNDISRDLGLAAHNEGVVVADGGNKLFRLEAGLDLHLGVGTQNLYPFLGKLVGN